MSTPTVSLGYVILYVENVDASLAFYEKAFGLKRRFFQDDAGRAYGELETGATRLAFASLPLVHDLVGPNVVATSPTKPPIGAEIALVTDDVVKTYTGALAAGAISVSAPAKKPWGQTVAYVRDNAGHLVELCTPLP